MSFDKKYDSKEAESRIRAFWDKEKIYKFDEKTKKKIYSIDTPPPTMSGRMHIGHAFSYTQTDFIARYKRMSGNEVFYPFGTDDNGLATEKLVQKEKKVDLRKMTRKEAVKMTMDYLNEERPKFTADFKNVGLSCDFDIGYSTISPYSQAISQRTFIEMFNKGLIEQREGPVPWDRVFQTPIAQAELEDKKLKSTLNYIKARLVGTKDTYLIYATTRPEILHACVGMNVEDRGEYVKLKVGDEFWITGATTYVEKFKDFEYEVVEKMIGQDIIGEKVVIPFSQAEIEVTHDISVKADYGTGVVYYCTYGGMDCIEWMARYPHVKPIRILDEKGKLTKLAGKYEGLTASTEGRSKIIKDLEEEGHMVKKDKIEHIVNVGERSGAEVEYIVSKQWYVKYLDRKEQFWENAQKFNWHPDFMKHRIENWIKGLNWDWGFSRQRHFGIPIPVWVCQDCGKVHLPDVKDLPVDPTKDKVPVKKCECGSTNIKGETDVLDTWFTSASSPSLSTENIKDKKVQEKLFPMDLRPQGHDIINFWLFYTMAKNNLIHDKNPFENVAISGWVLDPSGKKMSKSKGNTIAPQDIVEKYSNDAIRFAASSTKLGQDIPFQEKEVQTGVKVANKIYNACKFADMLFKDFKKSDRKFEVKDLRSIDKWILAKLYQAMETSTEAFENYDYVHAKIQWEHFFMHSIADNYLEIVKNRMWNPDDVGKEETKKAQQAFYTAIYASMRGLAPFMPYITEEVYQNFFSKYEDEKSIHQTVWPNYYKKEKVDDLIVQGDAFVSVVGAVRKYKSEKQQSMKEEVKELIIECDKDVEKFIKDSIADLKAVTNSLEVSFGKGKIETDSKDVKISIK